MNDRRSPSTEEIIRHVDERIAAHTEDEMARYRSIEAEIAKIHASLADLLDTWQAAKGVLAFLKFCAALGAGVVAVLVWVKDHVKW
jgi:hypothetical protein